MLRPLRDQGVEVAGDRQNAGTEGDVLPGQPGRVAVAVPPFVVAQNQRRHGIGERDAADDLRSDLRVDPKLLKLLLCQRARFREDVLGHRQFADVAQQRGSLDALDLRIGHPERTGQARGVDLHALSLPLADLVLGFDGERERFDGGQVQIRHLLHVTLLILDSSER